MHSATWRHTRRDGVTRIVFVPIETVPMGCISKRSGAVRATLMIGCSVDWRVYRRCSVMARYHYVARRRSRAERTGWHRGGADIQNGHLIDLAGQLPASTVGITRSTAQYRST